MFLLFFLFLDMFSLNFRLIFQIELIGFHDFHTIFEKSSCLHDGISKHFLIIFDSIESLSIFFYLLFRLKVRILVAIINMMSHLLATHTLCISKLFLFILILHHFFFFIIFVFLLLMLLFLATWLLFSFLTTAPPDVLLVKVFTSMSYAAPLEVLIFLKVFDTKLTCLKTLVNFTFSVFKSLDSINKFIYFFTHLRYLSC